MPDKEKQVGDVRCAESGYNSQSDAQTLSCGLLGSILRFTEGLSSDVAASTNYLGLQAQSGLDSEIVGEPEIQRVFRLRT